MRRLLAGLAGLAILGVPDAVFAQDEPCEVALLRLPVESIVPPDGMEWDRLDLFRPPWAPIDGAMGPTTSDQEYPPTIHVSIFCSADAVLLVTRLDEVTTALGLDDEVGTVVVGDATVAVRDQGRGTIAITWANGPFVATVSTSFGYDSSTEISFGQLEAAAQAVNAVFGEP